MRPDPGRGLRSALAADGGAVLRPPAAATVLPALAAAAGARVAATSRGRSRGTSGWWLAPGRGGAWHGAGLATALAVAVVTARLFPAAIPSLGLVGLLGLAYANGANDVSKGVATLVGSGTASYRAAIGWGALWTAVGGVLAAYVAGSLVAIFSSGLLADDLGASSTAALAVLFGSGAWVLCASRVGLPVSTTHAITGALVAVALVASGPDGVRWSELGGRVALPLAVSPFLAGALALAAYAALRFLPRRGLRQSLHWAASGVTSLGRGLNGRVEDRRGGRRVLRHRRRRRRGPLAVPGRRRRDGLSASLTTAVLVNSAS